MEIMDISHIDVNDLGVRLRNWTDNKNDLDFDDISNGYFGDDELQDFGTIFPGNKLMNNQENTTLLDDEDDSNYEIDPETGEKTYCGVVAASIQSLSSSSSSSSSSSLSNKWIEECLLNIESSLSTSANQLISNPITTTTTTIFENLPFNSDQIDFDWVSKYISSDESTINTMVPDQFSTNQEKPQLSTTAPIFIPQLRENTSDSLLDLFNASTDDEYSINSHSSNYQQRRIHSSFESDSMTRDSGFTFDPLSIEPKLEKIEPDDYFIPRMFVRRSSTRSNHQGQQDEEALRRFNIPLSLYDITQSSTEEYNRHLGRLSHLSAEQIHIIKDIRRRGKNKIAAQNCRKRKAINVETLLEEVDELKRVKYELEQRKQSYQQQIVETRHLYEYLHHQVLPNRQLPPAISVK